MQLISWPLTPKLGLSEFDLVGNFEKKNHDPNEVWKEPIVDEKRFFGL